MVVQVVPVLSRSAVGVVCCSKYVVLVVISKWILVSKRRRWCSEVLFVIIVRI